MPMTSRLHALLATFLMMTVLATGCANTPTLSSASEHDEVSVDYLIGPGDTLDIFVWRNPQVSVSVPVRPDGKVSTPLVEDLVASGKTPTQLARDIEAELSEFIKNPSVTVIVKSFASAYNQQIRVVGEAANPQSLPYRDNMTLLDVLIAVGGLTEFAAGNKATVVRTMDGKQKEFNVHLDDLIKNGDIDANAHMMPGDILIIPQSWF